MDGPVFRTTHLGGAVPTVLISTNRALAEKILNNETNRYEEISIFKDGVTL